MRLSELAGGPLNLGSAVSNSMAGYQNISVAAAERKKSRPKGNETVHFNAAMRREGARIIFGIFGHNWREHIAVIDDEKGTFCAFQITLSLTSTI